MGVKCQIYHKNQGVYYAGQIVEGLVIFQLDKPTEYQSVILSLHGTGKSKWSERNDDDTDYIRAKVFQLPDRIPSSFKNKTCTIKYRLTVIFVKANIFSLNKEYNTEIHVAGFVEPIRQPLPIYMAKTLFKLFSRKNHHIKITGELTTTCVEPGRELLLNITVDNDTDEEPVISANLYQIVVCLAKKKKHEKSPKKIEGCRSAIAIKQRSKVNISLKVPTRRDLYTITCEVLRNVYLLQIQLNLPCPHIDSKVELPVVIGFKRFFNS